MKFPKLTFSTVLVSGHLSLMMKMNCAVFYQRGTAEELKQVYETANRYHFLHTLALLGVPLCNRPKLVSTFYLTACTILPKF